MYRCVFKSYFRNRRIQLGILLVFAVLVLIPAPFARGAGSEKVIAGELQSFLYGRIKNSDINLPGVMLHVQSPGFGPWHGAAGMSRIETGQAIKPDDRFRAGSIMKTFVAVVILQLVEEGLISLDDSLPDVLPKETAVKFADSDRITVRMLLNHTSGIAEWLTGAMVGKIMANPQKVWTVDEFLDAAAAQGPAFAPGENWAYSNTDYNLLGLVIEQATGQSWRQEIRRRIVEPLNLKKTLLPEPGDSSIPGGYAHGYIFMEGKAVDVSTFDPSMAGAAGGSALVTTTADLARFIRALMTGELFEQDETLDSMLTFVPAQGPSGLKHGYGLGLMKFMLPGQVEAIGHFGGTAGYFSCVLYLPTKDTTICMNLNVYITGEKATYAYFLKTFIFPVLGVIGP